MPMIELQDAQMQFLRLIEQARQGTSFVIAHEGRPIAKVVPPDQTTQSLGPRLGFATQAVRVPDDFDRLGEAEIDALFYGD